MQKRSVYGEQDPREMPAYGISEVAHYLQIPASKPKVIAMDPYLSFGRPVIEGTGITTAIIAERYKAGESIEELAHDYECPPPAIQEAIRCELDTQAA